MSTLSLSASVEYRGPDQDSVVHIFAVLEEKVFRGRDVFGQDVIVSETVGVVPNLSVDVGHMQAWDRLRDIEASVNTGPDGVATLSLPDGIYYCLASYNGVLYNLSFTIPPDMGEASRERIEAQLL